MLNGTGCIVGVVPSTYSPLVESSSGSLEFTKDEVVEAVVGAVVGVVVGVGWLAVGFNNR